MNRVTMAYNKDQRGEGRSAQRSVWQIGLMLGVGVMGAVDEIIFHQLLQWHHFYMDTTDYWRIFSDGLFHTLTTTLLFVGAILLFLQRRSISQIVRHRPFWAAIFVGAGTFQIFDGIVIHKVLRLHQVRENVDNLLPYDIAWNLSGVVILAIGIYLWSGSRDH
jgi:uncharacterized membrane protein